MVYKIIVSPRAQKEIIDAIDYYNLESNLIPETFILAIKDAYKTIETNPFFVISYKNIRVLKLKIFPYSLYFVINENKKIIKILSCFHQKRHPNKRPSL